MLAIDLRGAAVHNAFMGDSNDKFMQGPGYQVRHVTDVAPVACPCGQSFRVFTWRDGGPANVHVTEIRDSRRHYHRDCTEYYYILEGSGMLEVADAQIPLSPGLLVRIDPLTRHRGRGDFKALIVGVPPFREEDEYFD